MGDYKRNKLVKNFDDPDFSRLWINKLCFAQRKAGSNYVIQAKKVPNI